jgi:protocatechuate 3,4-dioxygenase, beta subunit
MGKPLPKMLSYIYHTNQKGIYPSIGNDPDNNRDGWGKRHGYIRGWIKTDANGFYQFYTLRPGTYPSRSDPAHIHITIKEPGLNEYYIDDFQFDDDPLLTTAKRQKQKNRGGDGILILVRQPNGIMQGTRHIILGKNIPDYP